MLQYPKVNFNHGWGIYEPPLLFSIEQDHMEIALLLLAQGERLDVNIRNKWGGAALSMAVRRGYITVVGRILRHRHVKVNSVHRRGTAQWCCGWSRTPASKLTLRTMQWKVLSLSLDDGAIPKLRFSFSFTWACILSLASLPCEDMLATVPKQN